MKNAPKKQPETGFSDYLITFWCGTAGWFTVLSLVVLLLGIIIGSENANSTVEIRRFLFLLPCACGLSAARMIRRADFHPVLRHLLHYLITLLSLFLFLWLPISGDKPFSYSLFALLLITVLYVPVRVIFYYLTLLFDKKRKA